jgi:hypothetical protein
MSDCGCASGGVDTRIIAGPGIRVRGIGTAGDPFVVESTVQATGAFDTPSLDMEKVGVNVGGRVRLAPLLRVADTPTMDLTLSGAGTEASPFVLSGRLAGVDLSGGELGNHLVKTVNGWEAGPAVPIPAEGAPQTSGMLMGDGTGPQPIRWKKDATYADFENLLA